MLNHVRKIILGTNALNPASAKIRHPATIYLVNAHAHMFMTDLYVKIAFAKMVEIVMLSPEPANVILDGWEVSVKILVPVENMEINVP